MSGFSGSDHAKIVAVLTQSAPCVDRWEFVHELEVVETGDRFPARYVLYSDYAHWPRGHMAPYRGNIHCLSHDEVVKTVAALHCKADACLLFNALSGAL